jgi:hypothetical protein
MSTTTKKNKSPKLTRTKILRAAVAFANKDGIESLSMRKLAGSLGVEAMSLYNHVSNKDDVLDGMVELIAVEIELSAIGGDWKEAICKRTISTHEVLLKYPWASALFVSRINVGPVMLHYVDTTIGYLQTAGFSYKMADYCWNMIDSYLYGFTLKELNFPFEPSEYKDVAQDFSPQLPKEQYPFLYALSAEVISGRHDGLQDFNFGLNLILDGIEKLPKK